MDAGIHIGSFNGFVIHVSCFIDMMNIDTHVIVIRNLVGSGTNIQYALTGSASEVNLDTDVKFGAEGYGTSVFTQDAGQWGTTSEAELSWGSDDWVIEGYVYMDERLTKPPYWKVALRHTNYNIDADFGNAASGTTNMRMRLVLDTSATGQTQYLSTDFSYSRTRIFRKSCV